MRRFVALTALLLLAGAEQIPAAPAGADARIGAERVPLDPTQPNRRRVGELQFLDGWALRSGDPRFGGISAMHVEGGRVLAVNDTGTVFRFAVPGRGSDAVSIRALPAGPGESAIKINRDVESLAVNDNRAWMGFEQVNAIWCYRLPGLEPIGSAQPPAMQDWPRNEGPEAMVRLRDGRFLVFAEDKKRPDGTTAALLFDRDPIQPGATPVEFGYRAPPDYVPTDATELPDGEILILNRKFRVGGGVSAKLVIAALPAPQPGAVIAGREIAALVSPLTVDNFEALSVTRERGRTIVWIASDDNFAAWQRTLLLKFALVD